MKKLPFKLLLFCAVMVLMTFACNKDEDGTLKFTHRIVSEKEYYNNQIEYETTYEYTGNRLTSITYQEGEYSDEILLSYPNANTIIGTGLDAETATFKLTNNLVTEVLFGTDDKMVLSYNSSGLITSLKDYEYNVGWILDYETTYTYSSGRLVQITGIEYDSEGNSEDKYTFSYNGKEINEQIHSYKETGGVWTESYKYVYQYTNGNITRMTFNYKDGATWEEEYYEEFTYDSYSNLVKSVWDGDNSGRTEYIYEEGNGNFRQIFGVIDYEFGYPIPNKKSQSTERNSNVMRTIFKLH